MIVRKEVGNELVAYGIERKILVDAMECCIQFNIKDGEVKTDGEEKHSALHAMVGVFLTIVYNKINLTLMTELHRLAPSRTV